MANCPNCGRRLGIKDWRQTCPGCGVNLILYDRQERLMKEADIAEVQHFHFQKKIDRVKAAFIGSKLAITRLFVSLLPLIPPFLPLIAGGKLSAPLPAAEGSISVLTLYKALSEEYDPSGLLPLLSGSEKTAAFCLLVSVVLAALAVLLTIVHFALNTLACSPGGRARNYAQDILLLLFIIGSGAAFAAMPENSFVSGGAGWGYFLWIASAAAVFAIDIVCFRKGIEVVYTQCYIGGMPAEEYFDMVEKGVPEEEIRAEMYRRLSALREQKKAALQEAGERSGSDE